MVIENLVKQVIENGGSISPLIIPSTETNGTGLMNPSIYVDKGELICNLRHVNYTLYHCEGEQLFINRWGPLAYLNPENDLKLRTTNFFCKLDKNLKIISHKKVDMSKFDVEPLWEFVGLEDVRLVRWDNQLYMCGVRRDTTTNGEGRMEISELSTQFKEISRNRISPPNDPNSYCEKNWMPIIDMPFHFVKWGNATEVVKVDIKTCTSETIVLKDQVGDINNLRGGSQVIPYKNKRICIVHEVLMSKNKLDQRDARYTHRFIIWDKDWNIEHISEQFNFMTGEIEFCCGLALQDNNLIISFGFQDNAAFILKMPTNFFESFVKMNDFNWGEISENSWFLEKVNDEIFIQDSYQKFFKVEEGDIVVDIGASVGPFTYKILEKNPKHVFCLEPQKQLFKTLASNLPNKNITLINKGIAKVDGEFLTRGLYDKTCINTWEKESTADGIKFDTFLKTYDINKIDFLKVDCEGAEYDILTSDKLNWFKDNVTKIVGEFHLNNEYLKSKFREFRDNYLVKFKSFQIYSMDDINIKWDIWNEHFIEYYQEIMIYIDNRAKKEYWRTTIAPTLEITTSIPTKGCAVNCAFCPQLTLLNVYNSDKTMTLENFKKIINKLPKEIRITFSGFTEPWLNRNTTDMLLYAHEQSHPISVFTTGIGMCVDDIKRIKNIPFNEGPNGGFCLHLPDDERIAKHPMSKTYIEVLEYIKSVQNEIQGFYLMSMGPVLEEIRYIFPSANTPDMWSRAGNLLGEAIIKPELDKIKDRFKSVNHGNVDMTCACDEKLYHNVVLPNGDVSLCCMDYGLKHILGNIYTEDYDDIIPAPFSCFKLCQLCENGITPKNIKNI